MKQNKLGLLFKNIQKVSVGVFIFTVVSAFPDSEKFILCRPPWGPGRLGNQLFPIAAAISLGIDYDTKVYFPYLNEHSNSDIPTNKEKILWRLDSANPPHNPAYSVRNFCPSKLEDPLQKIVVPVFRYGGVALKLQGYGIAKSTFDEDEKGIWPLKSIYNPFEEISNIEKKLESGVLYIFPAWSENHFVHNKEKVLSYFDISDEIYNELYTKYREIIDHPYSVSIHVRTLKGEELVHCKRPFYGEKFLKEAIRNFPEDALFVVFSDDIQWCKNHLSSLRNKMVFIENEPYYNDFYLMSLCKHNIVTNSTFSWWGAYLNKNPEKKVIAPRHFFFPDLVSTRNFERVKDLWPSNWVLIDGYWEVFSK